MLEKLILIYFQPFQKQIKVSTKFHNFKSQEKFFFFRPPVAAGDPLWPPSDPPKSPQDPPKRPRIDPKARLCFGFPTPEPPVPRFCHPVFGFLQAISILYRYSIDTVSCFDRLEWTISACWSILAKNHIISLWKMYFYDRYSFYVRIVFW